MTGIASVILRHEPNYRSQAVIAGFKKHGYKIASTPHPNPTENDVLLIWNRYSRYEHHAKMYKAAGGKVIIMENGYIGHAKALAIDHHNGAGTWAVGNEDRWHKFGVELREWRTDGSHILVLPQRGIGEPGVSMPRNWLVNTMDKIKRYTDRPIKVRKHPGTNRCTPLEDDLANAWACVTWGSGAAIKAIAHGVPVFHEFGQWIGAGASNCNMDIEDPYLGDRLGMFERLSWAQFFMSEIESGYAFEVLLCK